MTITAELPTSAVRKPTGFVRVALGMWHTRFGLVLVSLIVGIAFIGPYFAPYKAIDAVGDGLPAQSNVPGTWFGSDKLAHDVWSLSLIHISEPTRPY